MNFQELQKLILRNESVEFFLAICFGLTLGFISGMIIMRKTSDQIKERLEHSTESSPELQSYILKTTQFMFVPWCFFPLMASLIASTLCVFMKCGILTIFTFHLNYTLKQPFFYFIWGGLPLIAVNLVIVLNMTFAHFPQLEVVPIY